MKKHLKIIAAILVCFAFFLPFASNAPDGLEKVAETFGVEEVKPTWIGLMPDYLIPNVSDSYFSTFLAGIFGFFLVLATAFVLGKMVTKRESDKTGNV